jgi:hypothetical protein
LVPLAVSLGAAQDNGSGAHTAPRPGIQGLCSGAQWRFRVNRSAGKSAIVKCPTQAAVETGGFTSVEPAHATGMDAAKAAGVKSAKAATVETAAAAPASCLGQGRLCDNREAQQSGRQKSLQISADAELRPGDAEAGHHRILHGNLLL